jgi:hypothetical protein
MAFRLLSRKAGRKEALRNPEQFCIQQSPIDAAPYFHDAARVSLN